MEALFELLFKYRPVVFERGSLGFDWPLPWVVLMPLALVAAVAAAWWYRAGSGGLTSRDQWMLGGLRVAAILIVAMCLARPVLAVSRAIEQRNVVGVVVDDSRSMQIAVPPRVVILRTRSSAVPTAPCSRRWPKSFSFAFSERRERGAGPRRSVTRH